MPEVGAERVAGVDEAGRGALAGPVVAAAVVLGPDHGIKGLNDSKQLSARRRDTLFDAIRERAAGYAIAEIDHARIDAINILQATLQGMCEAVAQLSPAPTLCLVDGNACPPVNLPVRAVVGGDALYPEIMAASILAKVHRDRCMQALDLRFPAYGFARNKGYPTAAHRQALAEAGPCPVHRLSYGPVAQQALALGAGA